MKTKTQELMLANELFQGLYDGGKRVTIRKGRRDIQLGDLLFKPTDANEGIQPVYVNVVEVRYKRLCDVTDEEAQSDGFENATAMKTGMKRYYPDLEPENEVTFVIFTC